MLRDFKVLHSNIGKRETAYWTLLCDKILAYFDILIVIEPYTYDDMDTSEAAFLVRRTLV